MQLMLSRKKGKDRLNRAQNKITLPAPSKRRRRARAAAALALLTACSFTAGCTSHNDPPPPAAGQGANVALTPEQEAARQRAMQTGAAMDAARDAAAKKASGGQ